ncbi:TPA: ECs1072 family phage-associated protein [Serratia marcescens]
MSVLHNLWHVIKAKVCQNRNLNQSAYYSGSHQDNCIKNRSAQLLILELVLHEHRKKFSTIFQPLSGKVALYHLIFTKTNWKPAEIRNLSLSDSLFIIQDELRIDKLADEVKSFIDTLELPGISITFDELLDEDWDPKENVISLATLN